MVNSIERSVLVLQPCVRAFRKTASTKYLVLISKFTHQCTLRWKWIVFRECYIITSIFSKMVFDELKIVWLLNLFFFSLIVFLALSLRLSLSYWNSKTQNFIKFFSKTYESSFLSEYSKSIISELCYSKEFQ